MKTPDGKQITTTIVPLLLGRCEMAAALSISTDLLDELRKKGLPTINVPGSSKILFHPPVVVEWLLAQSKPIETLSEQETAKELDSPLRNK